MKLILATLILISSISLAEIQWTTPLENNWTVEGRLHSEKNYHRLPASAKSTVRPAVYSLSQQSAGLSLRFWSNSPEIHLKYKLSGNLALPHMPATGVSGFDLYRRTREGGRMWVACTKPSSKEATVKLASDLDSNANTPALYTLYLPLYNSVTSLEIGVPSGKTLYPAAPDQLKPIVIYGTSIAQGACASRPGLSWTNTLSRNLDYPVVNLGFSGNGKMELPVADIFIEQDAALYVIDCLPNLTAQQVKEKIRPLIKRIRSKRPKAPILLVEEAQANNSPFTRSLNRSLYMKNNELYLFYFEHMLTDFNLHYLASRQNSNIKQKATLYLLGNDGEATVDNVHPNDIGMQRIAQAYEKTIRPILGMSTKSLATGSATTQLREIPGYNFMLRHQQILTRNKEVNPDVVWIGDSIIHFFGGEPEAHIARGKQAWDDLFKGISVTNMAYGWDRTDNVLWRIQHGELDDITPKTVILSIGTNDLVLHRSAEEIASAILQLGKEIRAKQPQAKIIITGILPRKGHLKKRLKVNEILKTILESAEDSIEYLSLASSFPEEVKDGKKLISGMTRDQLHPSQSGYEALTKAMRPILAPAKADK